MSSWVHGKQLGKSAAMTSGPDMHTNLFDECGIHNGFVFVLPQVLTHPDEEAAKVWLEDCRHSFAQMIHDKLTRDAEEAKTKVGNVHPLSCVTQAGHNS